MSGGQFGREVEVDGPNLLTTHYLPEWIKLRNVMQLLVPSGGVDDIHVFQDLFIIYDQQQRRFHASGNNLYGQCGVGSESDFILKFTPIEFVEDNNKSNPIIISEGVFADHVIIRLEDGSFYGWGSNTQKQLGIGSNGNGNEFRIPVNLGGGGLLLKVNIIQIGCGGTFSAFLTDGGKVFACGNNGDFGRGTGITNRDDNNDNDDEGDSDSDTDGDSENGNESVDGISLLPTEIGGVLENVRIKHIAVGYNHVLCLADEDGNRNVFAFGKNESMQLGDGDGDGSQSLPIRVTFFDDYEVEQVIAGQNSSAVIVADGKCFMFGENEYTELFTVEPVHPCAIHCIQQTLGENGDFSEFDDDDDYRTLSSEERLRLQWIFSEQADMKVVDVAFGYEHTIVTANIQQMHDESAAGKRQQIFLATGDNDDWILTSRVQKSQMHIPYEITREEIGVGDEDESRDVSVERVIATGYSTACIIRSLSSIFFYVCVCLCDYAFYPSQHKTNICLTTARTGNESNELDL